MTTYVLSKPLRNTSKLNIQEKLHMINVSINNRQIRITNKQYCNIGVQFLQTKYKFLIKIRNNNATKIEPCDAPHFIFLL